MVANDSRDGVHARRVDRAECGVLTVEGRCRGLLVAERDEERARGGVHVARAGHGHGAVSEAVGEGVVDAVAGELALDSRQAGVVAARGVALRASLHAESVLEAVEGQSIVVAVVRQLAEVADGDWRLVRVERDLNRVVSLDGERGVMDAGGVWVVLAYLRDDIRILLGLGVLRLGVRFLGALAAVVASCQDERRGDCRRECQTDRGDACRPAAASSHLLDLSCVSYRADDTEGRRPVPYTHIRFIIRHEQGERNQSPPMSAFLELPSGCG